MEIILVLMICFIVIIALLASRFIDNSNPYPFSKKQSIYSNTERSFYQMLEKAVGPDYKILTRVKLTDIIEPKGTATIKNRRAALIKASAKSVDFVLCDKKTLAISGVVDLVNSATSNGHRAKADWFVNGALEAAGIPHIRIKIKSGYTTEDIRNCVLFKLGKIKSPKAVEPLIKGTMGNSPLAHLKNSGLRRPSNALAQAS
jgi:hypothetical protein